MRNRLITKLKCIFLGITSMMFICCVGCSEIKEGLDDATLTFFETELSAPTGVKVTAVGAEFDPHFLSQNVSRNDGAKAEDWDMIIKRVKGMKLQSFRVMVLPDWFEPVNDNADPATINWDAMTFNTAEMQSLYKVLDLAQENNIEVTLVLWGCSTNARLLDPANEAIKVHFLATGNSGNWVVAPNNNDEWSENFSALVQYLINTKHYTCVKEVTPINEPDWSYYVGSSAAPAANYIAMCKVLDARFKTDGIRDKVRFNLSDNSDGGSGTSAYLESCTRELANVADVFNSHTYIFGYDTPNSTIVNWEKKNCQLTAAAGGKRHFLGEFGSNMTVGSSRQGDIDFYKRGVLMVRIALNVFNAGGTGMSYWGLIDQYFNRDAGYSEMQQLGMWKYVKEAYKIDSEVYNNIKSDYEPRPQYYAYSLLSRFVRPGADVYPIEIGEDLVAGSAFKGTDGKWVYVLANGTAHNKPVAINGNDGCDGSYDVYKYEEGKLPADDSMIASSETMNISGKKLSITIRRQTVVVLVQK